MTSKTSRFVQFIEPYSNESAQKSHSTDNKQQYKESNHSTHTKRGGSGVSGSQASSSFIDSHMDSKHESKAESKANKKTQRGGFSDKSGSDKSFDVEKSNASTKKNNRKGGKRSPSFLNITTTSKMPLVHQNQIKEGAFNQIGLVWSDRDFMIEDLTRMESIQYYGTLKLILNVLFSVGSTLSEKVKYACGELSNSPTKRVLERQIETILCNMSVLKELESLDELRIKTDSGIVSTLYRDQMSNMMRRIFFSDKPTPQHVVDVNPLIIQDDDDLERDSPVVYSWRYLLDGYKLQDETVSQVELAKRQYYHRELLIPMLNNMEISYLDLNPQNIALSKIMNHGLVMDSGIRMSREHRYATCSVAVLESMIYAATARTQMEKTYYGTKKWNGLAKEHALHTVMADGIAKIISRFSLVGDDEEDVF